MTDKQKEWRRQYYLKNKDRINAQNKQYYQDHKEEAAATAKKYREDHREEVLAAAKRYRDSHKKERAEWHDKYKDTRRHLQLLNSFGISLDQYIELFDLQNGCCAICGKSRAELSKSLAVDHDHKTGVIRGLLCCDCNLVIGNARDDITVLESAINYLRRTG